MVVGVDGRIRVEEEGTQAVVGDKLIVVAGRGRIDHMAVAEDERH